MFKYETHLHTSPVSKCARATVRESLEFYKSIGYDGVFITNHFLDGNINADKEIPYDELIEFYFSDYEEGLKIGKEIGIKVFCGVESSYKGTDFLVYGLCKEWYLKHPEIISMKRNDLLRLFLDNGALVIQAHPYREASYIDHIRLFPRCVHGVEVINSTCTPEQNNLAKIYAGSYQLVEFAGSDNHNAHERRNLAGMCCEEEVTDERQFVEMVKNNKMNTFQLNLD